MADPELIETDELREEVRRRYAEAATSSQAGCCGEGAGCGCGESVAAFGATHYGEQEREEAPLQTSLGCGNPTAVAALHEAEVVLDLGSGAGGDVLLSARRVGPSGKAYGLDMTDEMLALARRNASAAGLANVEFLKGEIENIPLAEAAVDVVISNCVINLSGDKPTVLREAFRVLRPGGRFAVSDVIADEDMDGATRRDMAQWTGCIAGALTAHEFRAHLETAGFEDIELTECTTARPRRSCGRGSRTGDGGDANRVLAPGPPGRDRAPCRSSRLQTAPQTQRGPGRGAPGPRARGGSADTHGAPLA